MAYKFNPFTGKLDQVGAGGGGGTPGGSDTQVQFNDGGTFGGDAGLTYNKTTDELTLAGDLNLDDGVGGNTTTIQAVTPTQDRTISFPDATGTVALVNGANGTIQYNDAGTLKGNSDFTVDPDWNDASTVFTGLKLNVTNTASAAGSNLVDIQSNGTSDVVIDSSGRVGIGTTSPNNLLTLNSNTASTAVTIQSSDTGAAAIVFGDQNDFSRGRVVYNNSTDSLAFETNNLNEAFRITSDGKLGLGISNPIALFHAAPVTSGGASSAEGIKITAGSSATGINIGANSSGTYGWIQSANWGTAYAPTVINPNGGNVGIASTAPGDKLEIGGAGAGIILASPDGTRYRLTVTNAGVLSIVAV